MATAFPKALSAKWSTEFEDILDTDADADFSADNGGDIEHPTARFS